MNNKSFIALASFSFSVSMVSLALSRGFEEVESLLMVVVPFSIMLFAILVLTRRYWREARRLVR